jgi:hypothetical protein
VTRVPVDGGRVEVDDDLLVTKVRTEMHDDKGPVAATMSLGPSRNWGSTTNDGAVPEAGVLGRSAEVRSAVVGSDVGVPSIGGHAWAGADWVCGTRWEGNRLPA